MAYILNIETSTRVCSVALTLDGKVIAIEESNEKNSHAENITLFSEKVIINAGISFNDLDAVAVSKGPGSYTGLRIGVSTAKGYCYALDIPLIAVGTLNSLASGMISQVEDLENSLFVPMIDARRMEVYSAIFDDKLNEIRETKAEIIEKDSFKDLLNKQRIVFAGDGAGKCAHLLGQNSNAVIIDELFPSSSFMRMISYQKYVAQDFEDVAYFEPYYLKDFVPGIPRVKGLK